MLSFLEDYFHLILSSRGLYNSDALIQHLYRHILFLVCYVSHVFGYVSVRLGYYDIDVVFVCCAVGKVMCDFTSD